jgi:hypothetical protein
LGKNIGKNVPNSWKFLKSSGSGERICGWSCDRQILGTQRPVQIAFCFAESSSSLSESRWPIMNCWTGISLGLPAGLRDQLLKAAGQLSIRTEKRDGNWVLWEYWTQLSNTNSEGLHERLTGSGRAAAQQEIVNELASWTTKFDNVLNLAAQPA